MLDRSIMSFYPFVVSYNQCITIFFLSALSDALQNVSSVAVESVEEEAMAHTQRQKEFVLND
jgi:hypothetical protein